MRDGWIEPVFGLLLIGGTRAGGRRERPAVSALDGAIALDRAARVDGSGFDGLLAGEVLAWGRETSAAAVDWWLRSPPHTGGWVWVIVLGRSRGSAVPFVRWRPPLRGQGTVSGPY